MPTTDLEALIAAQDPPPPEPDATPPADSEPGLPATDEPPPVDEPTDSPPGDGGDDPEPGEPTVAQRMAERGLDMAKYQDDEAVLDGAAAAIRRLGQRTEEDRTRDAALEALRTQFGDEELAAMVAGKADSKADAKKPKPAGPEQITESQVELWRTQLQAGTLSPPNEAKLRQRIQDQETIVNALVNGQVPDSIRDLMLNTVETRLEKFTQEHAESSKQQQAETDEKQRTETWLAKHGEELYTDPKLGFDGPLTPLGQKWLDAYSNDPSLQDTPIGVNRAAIAYKFVAPQPVLAKTPAKPSRAAKHEPGTNAALKVWTPDEWWAAPENRDKSAEEYFVFFDEQNKRLGK